MFAAALPRRAKVLGGGRRCSPTSGGHNEASLPDVTIGHDRMDRGRLLASDWSIYLE